MVPIPEKKGAKNLNRIQRLIAIRVIQTYRIVLAEVALLPTGMVPFTLIAQADDEIFQRVQASPVE